MALVGADRLKEATSFDESKIGVKGLSDAGVTTIPRFFVHPPETLSSLNSSVSLSIPVIDLSGLNSPDGRAAIVDRVRSAAATWGFFQVINHGVPGTAMDGVINAVKAFHEQPPEAKRVYYTRGAAARVGFSYGTNIDLYKSKAAFWNDHFRVPTSPDPRGASAGSIPEICRREVVEWDARVARVGEAVMELLCEGLGVGSRRFQELTCVDGRAIFGMCYPYCPQPDLTLGLTSHTDQKFLTVLLTNHVPGLQVKHADDWVDVHPVPGGLIINVGDLLQIMSNDEYKSVQHRVRSNSSPEPRISAIMFFDVGKYKETDEFGPLPELVSPEKPLKYRNFTYGEFKEVYMGNDLNNKTVVEAFKIKKSILMSRREKEVNKVIDGICCSTF